MNKVPCAFAHTVLFIRLKRSMQKGISRRPSVIRFAGISYSCLALFCVNSTQINPVLLETILALPMFVVSSPIFLATQSEPYILAAETNTGAASQAAATVALTSVSFFSGLVLKLAELHGTTCSECGNMSVIFSSTKPVPKRTLTAAFFTMSNIAFVEESLMRACK